MLTERISSPVDRNREQQPIAQEQLHQMLRAYPVRHPALNRVQAKMVASSETEAVISSYDRMHHRHSRS